MFSKKDLKTGYIVVVSGKGNEEKKCMVLLGTANGDIVSGETWFPLDSYSDCYLFGEDYDEFMKVIKVYRPRNNCDYRLETNYNLSNSSYELVWERKEETEQQKQIRELKETIDKARKQIEELEKTS